MGTTGNHRQPQATMDLLFCIPGSPCPMGRHGAAWLVCLQLITHFPLLLERVLLQRYVGMEQRQPPPMQRGPGFEYRYLTEFQSHEPEFDYLKSLEIEEKINKVRWVRSSNNTKHIIATNDKTIKLWKVRHVQRTCDCSGDLGLWLVPCDPVAEG